MSQGVGELYLQKQPGSQIQPVGRICCWQACSHHCDHLPHPVGQEPGLSSGQCLCSGSGSLPLPKAGREGEGCEWPQRGDESCVS